MAARPSPPDPGGGVKVLGCPGFGATRVPIAGAGSMTGGAGRSSRVDALATSRISTALRARAAVVHVAEPATERWAAIALVGSARPVIPGRPAPIPNRGPAWALR